MDEPDVDALLSEAETAQIDFENGKLVFVTYEGTCEGALLMFDDQGFLCFR